MKFLTLLVFAFYSGCLYNLVHTPLNIEVGPCFGTCLSYNLEVIPNGAYLLVDNHKTTISKGKLSKKQRKSLKPILAKISVKNQQKNFGNPKIRDLSKIKISFNSTNIEINGRNFAPQPYKSLLKWADEFYTNFYDESIQLNEPTHVTDYAKTNIAEDIAESFTYYIAQDDLPELSTESSGALGKINLVANHARLKDLKESIRGATNVGLFYNSPIRAHFNRTIDGKQISCTDYQKITHNLKEGMFKLK